MYNLYHGLRFFFFDVACSLIVLDCTLRKIQQNIQVGGAKLQRTVLYISADIRYTARQLIARFFQLLIYVPVYSSFFKEQGHL